MTANALQTCWLSGWNVQSNTAALHTWVCCATPTTWQVSSVKGCQHLPTCRRDSVSCCDGCVASCLMYSRSLLILRVSLFRLNTCGCPCWYTCTALMLSTSCCSISCRGCTAGDTQGTCNRKIQQRTKNPGVTLTSCGWLRLSLYQSQQLPHGAVVEKLVCPAAAG